MEFFMGLLAFWNWRKNLPWFDEHQRKRGKSSISFEGNWDNFRVDHLLLKKLGASVNVEKNKMQNVYIAIARYSQKNDFH